MGTTRSYACATQAGLTQLGSNVMHTSRGGLPVRPRRATLASLYLWRGACLGQHALERCPQKPITIPRSQLCSWNARRELYQHVGNFVGSVSGVGTVRTFTIRIVRVSPSLSPNEA
jgi:hypothetical protein